jgi:drug/metabolite transporter (DMT)-like permease
MSEAIKSPWMGTNIYGQILLLIASLFGGMSQDTSGLIVAGGAGVVGAVLAARNWITTAKFNLEKSWVKDPNNIAYLTAVIVAISPKAGELIPGAVDVFNALSSGNWGAIISAAVSLASIAYYSFFKNK